MGRKRNTTKGDAMMMLYDSGRSLEQVAAAFGVTRQSVYVMLKRRGVTLRAPNPRQHTWFNGEKFTVRNNGYFGRTTGDRAMMHRVVWEHHRGPIPAGYDIHHIDKNRLNNDIANLELIAKDDHARHHALHG
jgi:hypothetical protein